MSTIPSSGTRLARRMLAATCLVASPLAGAAIPLPMPDPNFYCGLDGACGNQGYSVLTIDRGGDDADTVAQAFPLGDGSTLVVGRAEVSSSDRVIAIGRLAPGGAVDTGFGVDGKQLGSFQVSSVYAAALDNGGRIWVLFGTPTFELGLARFTADGLPDDSFSGDGRMTFDIAPQNEIGGRLLLTADGKAVIAASVQTTANAWQLGVARITADGNLDSTFDGDGVDQIDLAQNGAPAQKWQPAFITAPGGNTGAIATVAMTTGGVSGFSSYSVTLIPNGPANIGFGVSEIAGGDAPGCAVSVGETGTTVLLDAAPVAGGYVAAGLYVPPGGESRALFGVFPASGADTLECFTIGADVGSPRAIEALGAKVFAVHSYIDATTRRLDLLDLDASNDFTPVVHAPMQAPRHWPNAGSGDAALTGWTLAAANGRVVLGVNRTWSGNDTDIALAGYFYSPLMFVDDFE